MSTTPYKTMALLLARLAIPSAAFASEAAAQHGGSPTAGQWLLLLFAFINFAGFVYLFRRFAGPPLREFLEGRRQELVELMAAAERAKSEAERLKREYEAKTAALDQTRRELIAEVREIAEADRRRMLAGAQEASARLLRDAERAAHSDIERARRELRAAAARLAAEIASAEVARRMDEPTRHRLFAEFLAGVSRK